MPTPSSISLRMASVLLLATFSLPQSLEAQLRLRVGGGVIVHDHGRLLPPEAAFHAGVDATLDLNSVMGLRLGSFIGTGGLASESPALGAELELLAQWRAGSAVRPYVGLGLSFTKTDLSAYHPLSHDFGYSIPIGAELGRSWFLEIQPRVFGNVFYTPTSTKSLTLVSLGWRIN